MGLGAIMGLTWNTMVKNLALRRRPYFDHESINILRVVEPEADIYDIASPGIFLSRWSFRQCSPGFPGLWWTHSF
jgi:hypothetical protein